MADFLYGSICLSDIPKELFKKVATKDGDKVFLNIAVSKRKEVSQYGDTHNIIASVPKDKRKDDDKPLYCGNLKEHIPQPVTTTEGINNAPSADVDDLPF